MSVAKVYQPSGNKYVYISNIRQDFVPDYTDNQVLTLARKNKDRYYPAEFCEQVVFGNVEMSLDVEWTNSLATPKDYEDSKVQLSDPLRQLYFDGTVPATHFVSGNEFGQPSGDTVASAIKIVANNNNTTSVEWYKNSSVVATETIGYPVSTFALAVTTSGNLIQSYAYIFMYNNEIWTSGVKSTSAVLSILNTSGDPAGQTQTFDAWSTENGEFIFSKIFGENGNDTYTGVVARDTSYTLDIDAINDILQSKCDQYGGWLGTDLVSYIAGTESNAEGWEVLNALTGDEKMEVTLPSSDGHVYTVGFYAQWEYNPGMYWYKVFIFTKDGAYLSPYIALNNNYRIPGSYVYITWYKQSLAFESKQQLEVVTLHSNVQGYYYEFDPLSNQLNNTDTEEVNDYDEQLEYINGYDPESGQADDPQEEPDSVQDPGYDPLASGFLWAFMVDDTDMKNLADCLVPDTLAQKIRSDFGNNLFEFIVSYHLMPCVTNASGLVKTAIAYRGTPFIFGSADTPLELSKITKTWYNVNCGTRVCCPTGIRVDGFENWSNAHVQLYLPFIGYVHLNTADVWNKHISISYRFDIIQGTCVANIGVGNNGTLYSFEGSCKYTIPFTSTIDKSNQELLSGLLSSANTGVSMAGAIASGNPVGVVSAVGGVGDSVGHFLSALEHKSIINRGGSLSGSPGWNMPRKPALIITVPDIIDVRNKPNYNKLNGYPSFADGLISAFASNYIECGSVDLIAVPNEYGALPNDNEMDVIKSQLKEGVYV